MQARPPPKKILFEALIRCLQTFICTGEPFTFDSADKAFYELLCTCYKSQMAALSNDKKRGIAERLYINEGMSGKAIAEELDISDQTIFRWKK
jgi:hypothetical protein